MDFSVVKQISCGILYNRSFSIFDKWGKIADETLYNNKYFSEQYFTRISDQGANSRSLTNDKDLHSLQITSNNVIYTHNVLHDAKTEYDQFKERVIKFIVPNIISSNHLITRRIGIVFTCESSDEMISNLINKYINPGIKGVTDIRFAKKETAKSAVFSENNNYINKIYTIGIIGSDQQEAPGYSFDFQLHFSPAREDIDSILTPFFKEAVIQLDNDMFLVGDNNGSKKIKD